MDEWNERIGKVYRPGETPGPGDAPPTGLALGDAWFWHGDQTLLHELVNHPDIAPGHAAIRLLGFNGGRLNEYSGDGAFAGVIRMHLVPGFRFSEFYLGNEIYPSAQGFRKILERAWLPRLRPFGIVTGK
jgi:hypothetical protein